VKQAERPDRRSGRASRLFLRHIEQNGIVLRSKAGLGPQGRLDPFAAAERFGVVVANLSDLRSLNQEDVEQLHQLDARIWSGGATKLPDGKLLVVLNPNQTPERAAVTLMEEIAHAHFSHEPSALALQPAGAYIRVYDGAAEDEAYWTAAAALLPSSVIAHGVWRNISVEFLASSHGVSVELVEFRIKTLRLWPLYREYCAAA
jgi:hypothetical protein